MIRITIQSFETYKLENFSSDYLEFSKGCLLLQFYIQVQYLEFVKIIKINFVVFQKSLNF